MEQEAELPDADRQLLVATQRRSAAVEAWALAFARAEEAKANLEELTRQRDEAQADVARWTTFIELAGRSRSPLPPAASGAATKGGGAGSS